MCTLIFSTFEYNTKNQLMKVGSKVCVKILAIKGKYNLPIIWVCRCKLGWTVSSGNILLTRWKTRKKSFWLSTTFMWWSSLTQSNFWIHNLGLSQKMLNISFYKIYSRPALGIVSNFDFVDRCVRLMKNLKEMTQILTL